MEGATGLASYLSGKTNPTGELSMTYPAKLENSPPHALGESPGNDAVHYNEGLLVGYRYFDTKSVEPLYPFGHGLSYSNFEFDSLKLRKTDRGAIVSLRITNASDMAGSEVIQVYVRDEAARLIRPEKRSEE